MLDLPYQKTEAGRAEIKVRSLPLSRSARNLLLMLDATRPAQVWIEMIKGTSGADFAYLLGHGLIMPVEVAAPSSPAPQAEASTAAEPSTGATAGYDELYEYLTTHARKHMGLIKGYRMVLDVERCTDLDSLRDLAWKLIAEVDRTAGEAVADQVRAEMRL
ncbi:MAG: hypothetical protein JO006_04925 [Paucibacter sp.]|nr:hypothetical protein [Roseateles sp.]